MAGVNRVAAVLLGAVLFGIGALTVVVTALAAAGYDSAVLPLPRWRDSLGTTAWSDRRVVGLSIVVGLVGLAVLFLQMRRWQPRHMPAGAGTGWRISRHSVESQAAAAAQSVPGVSYARVTSRRSRRGWSLRVTAEAAPEERETVSQAVRTELRRLEIPEDVPVDVDLHRRRIM